VIEVLELKNAELIKNLYESNLIVFSPEREKGSGVEDFSMTREEIKEDEKSLDFKNLYF